MKIAIIPARGGSKRVPRKNLRPFHGKPMLSRAIATAQESGLFDRIVVSTDDAQIQAVAIEAGADVPFLRPTHLADDEATTVPVIAHALRHCAGAGDEFTHACCIYPCTPLLEAADLVQAWRVAQEGDADFVYAIAEYPHPVQRALRMSSGGLLEYVEPAHAATRTQDLEPRYFDAGQFYWGKASAWLAEDGAAMGKALGFQMPHWRAVDIDTEDDWRRAELAFATLGRA